MRVFGCVLHRPSLGELTAAAITTAILGSILLATGLAKLSLEGGTPLVGVAYGAISSAMGLQVSKGPRYLVVQLAGCISVLLAFSLLR